MKVRDSLQTSSMWIAAAAAGAAAALLLAPMSGRRTRRRIKLGSHFLWDAIAGKWEKAQDRMLHSRDLADRGARKIGRKLKMASRIA